MDLAQLSQALTAFSTLSPVTFPLHQAQLFLEVAQSEPCTFEHLEQALNLTNSSVSRSVAALSDVNRHGSKGYQLLAMERDPRERRRYVVRLSARGKALLKQLKQL